MQIDRIDIHGFRAFSGEASFDLSADALVLIGDNGTGKTSFLDAILWGLTGEISRFRSSKNNVVSAYSRSGEASVRIHLTDGTGERIVTRTTGGGTSEMSLETPSGLESGSAAETSLRKLLWPQWSEDSSDDGSYANDSFRHAVYLQQDIVNEFIVDTEPHERFRAVAQLVGAGGLVELREGLKRSRHQWSLATTRIRNDECGPVQAKRDQAAAQLAALGPSSEDEDEQLPAAWTAWWSESQDLLGGEIPPLDAQGSRLLNGALQEMAGLLRTNDRRFSDASALLRELGDGPNVDLLQKKIGEDEGRLAGVRRQLAVLDESKSKLTEAQSKHRQEQASLRDRAKELSLLAQLALRHLSETCPVCTQGIDHDHVAERLTVIASEEPSVDATDPYVEQLNAIAEESAKLTAKATEIDGGLRRSKAVLEEGARREREVAEVVAELAPDIEGTPLERLSVVVDETAQRSARLRTTTHVGEQLALRVTKARESLERLRLVSEVERLDQKLATYGSILASRQNTHDGVSAILESLQEGSWEAVNERIRSILPVVRRIYASIDPHLSFTNVDLATSRYRGKEMFATGVSDPLTAKAVEPLVSLSSSQLNALAVSMFLSLNLGLSNSPLRTLMLDDPLQSLDDINLLGMVDVLRRVRGTRQVIVSTHDDKFGSLFARKLRPVDPGQRTRVIRFTSWSREGPKYNEQDVTHAKPSYSIAS